MSTEESAVARVLFSAHGSPMRIAVQTRDGRALVWFEWMTEALVIGEDRTLSIEFGSPGSAGACPLQIIATVVPR